MALVASNHVDVASADRNRSPFEEPRRAVVVRVAVGEKDGLHLSGLHALSVRPAEGREAVPFFPDLAREGQGMAATITDPAQIAAGVFAALLPREAASLGKPLAGAVERLFRGDE